MDFKTKSHQNVYEKVAGYLKELFGEMPQAIPDRPQFVFPLGTCMTHIGVHPWGDDDATIVVRAYVVFGADLRPDCLKYLLRENDTMRFGAFGVDKDGDIFFEHTIVGSTCDKEELRASTVAVAGTADRYDETIVERWGGMRFADRIKQLE